MAANKIYIQVDFQSDNANAAIDGLNKNIKTIGTASDEATAQATRGVNTLAVSISQATSEIASMGQALAGLGIAKLGESAVKAADDIFRLQFALRDLKGDMASTNLLYRQLIAGAQTSPFSVESFLKAGLALKSFGTDVNNIARDVTNLAKVMAAHGLQEDALQPTIDALNKMRAIGTARPQQLAMSLGSFGETMMGILGKSQPEVRQMMKAGEISGAGFADGFWKAIDKAAQQSDISELTDRTTAQWQKVIDRVRLDSEQLTKDLEPLLTLLLNTANRLLDIFEGMPEPLRKVAEYLGVAAAAVVTISGAIGVGGLVAGGVGNLAGMAGRAAAATGIGAGLGTVATGAAGGLLEGGGLVAGGSAAGGALAMIGTAGIVVIVSAVIGVAIAAALKAFAPDAFKSFKGWVDNTFFDGKSGAPKTTVPPLDTSKKTSMFQAPYGLTQTELKAAQEDLATAQEKNLGGVAAIGRKYQEIFAQLRKEGVTSLQVIATRQLAEAQRIENEIRTMKDETAKLTFENDKAKLDELAKYQERMAHEAAVDAETVAQDTLEKQVAVELQVAAIHEQGLAQAAQTRKASAQEEYDYHYALMKRQMDADLGVTTLTAKQRSDITAQYVAREQILKDTQRREDARADQLYYEQTAADRERIFKESAGRTTEYLKQARDEEQQYAIQQIQHQGQLAADAVKSGEDQNAQAKIDSINKVAQIQIDTAEKVYEQQKLYLEKQHQDALDAANLVGQSGYAGAADKADAERAAADRKFADDSIALASQTAYAEQDIRLKAWREGNEKMIEEQKQVYDALKTALGTVWDAFFQKGKSVWQALADAGKKAFMEMAKSIVTGAVAASLMQAVTGTPVTMASRGSFGTGPLGKLAGTLTQRPVFQGKPRPEMVEKPLVTSAMKFESKIDLPEHLGDATLVTSQPPPGTAGLPVHVVNQPGAGPGTATPRMTIDQNTTQQIKLSGSVGGSAGALAAPAVAAVVAAAAGGRNVSGGGGGYSTTSTISYDGGGSESFGGGTGSFGGGGFVSSGGGGDSLDPFQFRPYGSGGVIPFSGGGTFGSGGGITDFGDLAPTLAASSGAVPGAGLGAPSFGTGIPGLSTGTIAGLSRLATGGAGGGLFGLLGGAGPSLGLVGSLGGGLALAGGAAGLKEAWNLGQSSNTLSKVAAPIVGAASGLAGLFGIGLLTSTMFGPVGIAAALAVGAGIGIASLLVKSDAQKAHDAVQKAYGIDIKDQSVLGAIAQAAKKYGDFNVGIRSPEVQQIIHLYTLSQGINASGVLPRPMYSATLAQSSAAGGLQLQPVYSSGQVVASPYSGPTTQQWSQGIYLQLNPQQASDLLTGQIVDAMNNNPGTVANANATGLSSGNALTAQRNALIEPLTVMS